jgi:hypothetical protein
MATQAQVDANRANAQHSTGPRTPEGIANCKNNATRHGLCAQQIVIKGEDPAAYDALRGELVAQYAPSGELEAMLVEQIVQQWWRLERARRIESKMFDEFGEIEVYSNKAYLNLQRQMTSTERAWNRAIDKLEKIQELRAEQEAESFLSEMRSRPIGSVSAKPAQPPAARASDASGDLEDTVASPAAHGDAPLATSH